MASATFQPLSIWRRAARFRRQDQRMGQLMLNIARNEKGETCKQTLWNLTDEELLRRLEDENDE